MGKADLCKDFRCLANTAFRFCQHAPKYDSMELHWQQHRTEEQMEAALQEPVSRRKLTQQMSHLEPQLDMQTEQLK